MVNYDYCLLFLSKMSVSFSRRYISWKECDASQVPVGNISVQKYGGIMFNIANSTEF